MNAPTELEGLINSAAERSAVYRALSLAFTYDGCQAEPVAISGVDFNEAFDPSVSADASSLREGSYTEEDQSSLFEELMRFYAFFGLARGEGAEMPDHLSVELEFMHFLTHLESSTVMEPEALASLHRGQRDFLTRHVCRVLRGVESGLKSTNPRCVELVQTGRDFVDAEVALLDRLIDD